MLIVIFVLSLVGAILVWVGYSKEFSAIKMEKRYEIYKVDAPEDKFNRSLIQNILIGFKGTHGLLTLNDVPACCQGLMKKGRRIAYLGTFIALISLGCGVYHLINR